MLCVCVCKLLWALSSGRVGPWRPKAAPSWRPRAPAVRMGLKGKRGERERHTHETVKTHVISNRVTTQKHRERKGTRPRSSLSALCLCYDAAAAAAAAAVPVLQCCLFCFSTLHSAAPARVSARPSSSPRRAESRLHDAYEADDGAGAESIAVTPTTTPAPPGEWCRGVPRASHITPYDDAAGAESIAVTRSTVKSIAALAGAARMMHGVKPR